MNSLPEQCPVCLEPLVVKHLYCPECDTHVEGDFLAGFEASQGAFRAEQLYILLPFARLTEEQLYLVLSFVRCEGRINRLAEELGVSYPTLRSRMDEILNTLGMAHLASEESEWIAQFDLNERQRILDQLNQGAISVDQARKWFQGQPSDPG